MQFRFLPHLAALSAVVVVLAGVGMVDRSEQERFQQQNRAIVLNQLSTIRARLEGGVNSRLFLSRGLVAYVSNHANISQAEFNNLAKVIVAQQTGIDSIYLAKNTVVSHIYPLQGKEAALGLKLMKIPEEREAIQRAIDTKKTVVSGPFTRVEGGLAFASRTPIFLTPPGKAPETGAYWGLAGIGIEQDTLLEEAGMLALSSKLQYALRGKDGLGAKGTVFFGDQFIFHKQPVLLDVTLPNGSWQLAAIPVGGWPSGSPVRRWLLSGGSLLALLAGLLVFKWVRDPVSLRLVVERAIKALAISEAKYRELVENASSIIVRTDTLGNITFFNEFAQSFFGYSESEILGRNVVGTIVPTTDTAGNNLAEMVKDNLRHPQRYTHHENENIRRNGERVWVAWRNKALLDEAGRFAGILAIGTDISDRKRAEEALQKANDELELRVQQRTAELCQALEQLQQEMLERQQAEEDLRQSEAREREKATQLEAALYQLRSAQAQLIQSEKMSSLGQLVAGVAHELNNPVNFIHGNLTYVHNYASALLDLIHVYKQEFPQSSARILDLIEDIDLSFIEDDLPKTLSSMRTGTERIRQIVLSLRNFSRLDEAEMKPVDLHSGIESTLLILQNSLKGKNGYPDIQVVKEFGRLPLVECCASQLNQVFMNILTNAIDAIKQRYQEHSLQQVQLSPGVIAIRTNVPQGQQVMIEIADNGVGMTEAIKKQIFNPFFTTKNVGKGTGLGLSISYQIVVEQHKGQLKCISQPNQGAVFQITIPVSVPLPKSVLKA